MTGRSTCCCRQTLDALLQADAASAALPARNSSLRRAASHLVSSPQSPWTFGRRDANDAFSLVQCESNLRDNEAVPCAWPKDGDDARAAAAADRRREMGGGRSDCRNAWAAAAAFLAQEPGLPLRWAAADGSVFEILAVRCSRAGTETAAAWPLMPVPSLQVL